MFARCIAVDGVRTIDRIVAISDAGRAPKNDPVIFSLAMTAKLGDEAPAYHADDGNDPQPGYDDACWFGHQASHATKTVVDQLRDPARLSKGTRASARRARRAHALAVTAAGGGYGGKWGGGESGITTLSISPRQRLDDVVREIDALPMGGTDCALPMMWAQKHRVDVDTFVIYTDNETWAGSVHPARLCGLTVRHGAFRPSWSWSE